MAQPFSVHELDININPFVMKHAIKHIQAMCNRMFLFIKIKFYKMYTLLNPLD